MEAAANNLAILIATFSHEDQSKLEAALKLVEGFRESENPYFLDTLGWVHYRLGNATEAILYLEQAISSGLDIPELHYHMGMAYLAANEPEKAREHLEKAVVEGASYPGLQEARLTFSGL
jgi:tetratricopeptide (TPR) repeat protein